MTCHILCNAKALSQDPLFRYTLRYATLWSLPSELPRDGYHVSSHHAGQNLPRDAGRRRCLHSNLVPVLRKYIYSFYATGTVRWVHPEYRLKRRNIRTFLKALHKEYWENSQKTERQRVVFMETHQMCMSRQGSPSSDSRCLSMKTTFCLASKISKYSLALYYIYAQYGKQVL
jgi:hypothetical protein